MTVVGNPGERKGNRVGHHLLFMFATEEWREMVALAAMAATRWLGSVDL